MGPGFDAVGGMDWFGGFDGAGGWRRIGYRVGLRLGLRAWLRLGGASVLALAVHVALDGSSGPCGP